tara:strand:- start:1166 stop:1780 length:615 start_codon:yes stop_codon:yes gene_type:complete
MLERILDFLKNKYFIGLVVLLLVIGIVVSVINFNNKKADEIEFNKLIQINDRVLNASQQNLSAEELLDDLDLNFKSFSYEFTANALVAKKAVDEGNIDIALDIYLNMHGFILDETLNSGIENILRENLLENIVRIYMEKNDFDAGSNFLNNNSMDSLHFYELAGDFYKYFEKNDESMFHYNKALSFDINEAQKNIINLKKPTKK